MPSARVLSQVRAGPSGRHVGEEEFDSKEIEVVYSEPEIVEPEAAQGSIVVEPIVEESHIGEGILLKNSRSKVTNDEVKMLRYLYKVPSSVEI